jgi:GT2 family glycosyltransferase
MTQSDISITVIIVTRNRPHTLIECLQSLKKSSVSDFELILVDQSDEQMSPKLIQSLEFKDLKYFYMRGTGLSSGRNFGIRHAHGDILCFTDDDCIVDRNWMYECRQAFRKNTKIVGVFGSSKPYRPHPHKGKICPCVFTVGRENIISKPCLHGKYIGFGNNMAFRKEVFVTHGLFKEWLGVGSVGLSAEDAEFVLRLLNNKQQVLATRKAIIFHNKWLSVSEFTIQRRMYICGELSCYGNLALRGLPLGRKVIASNVIDIHCRIFHSIKRIVALKRNGFSLLTNTLIDYMYAVRGVMVAVVFTFAEKLGR